MGFLQNLMGGGQTRQEYEDFANRYQQGHPSEGYDDDEVMNRYQQVRSDMSPEDYQEASRESFSRMSPEERMQFGQYMQQQARARGYQDPAWDEDDSMYQDPNYLSQVTGRMESQQPGALGQVLGGAGNVLGNPLAKAALAGVTAFAAKRIMDRQQY